MSGLPRLVYDRTQPWRGRVRLFNDYRVTMRVSKPAAYLIRGGYWPVIERLQNAGVRTIRIVEPQRVRVQRYRIEDYETASRPYEGHYPHSQTQVSRTEVDVEARPGDVRHSHADLNAASEALGYSPARDIETGLTELIGAGQGAALP